MNVSQLILASNSTPYSHHKVPVSSFLHKYNNPVPPNNTVFEFAVHELSYYKFQHVLGHITHFRFLIPKDNTIELNYTSINKAPK